MFNSSIKHCAVQVKVDCLLTISTNNPFHATTNMFEISITQSPVEIIFFSFILVLCVVLVFVSLQNVLREGHTKPDFQATVQHYTKLRRLTLLCCILQLQCFFGYFVGNTFIHESAWNFWIVIGFLCLALLGINTAKLFNEFHSVNCQSQLFESSSSSSTIANKQNSDDEKGSSLTRDNSTLRSIRLINKYNLFKEKNIFYIYLFWILSSIFEIIGSIVGWLATNITFQFFCYGTWRFLTVISLILTVFRILVVRQIIKETIYKYLVKPFSDFSNGEIKILAALYEALKLLKKLIVCLIFLIIVLIINSIVIYTVFFQLLFIDNKNLINDYTFSKTPNYVIFGFYFPLWSFVQITNLFYTWIPYRQLKMNSFGFSDNVANYKNVYGNKFVSPLLGKKKMKYIDDDNIDKENLLADLTQMKKEKDEQRQRKSGISLGDWLLPSLSPLEMNNNGDNGDNGNDGHDVVPSEFTTRVETPKSYD